MAKKKSNKKHVENKKAVPKKIKLDDLEYIQMNTFCAVPPELFEQGKPNSFDIDKLYQYSEVVCSSPLTYLYWMIDNRKQVKGILWMTIDILSGNINVNVLSVDPEYQDKEVIPRVREKIREFKPEIEKALGIELTDKVVFSTSRPEAFAEAGAVRSELVRMEM